MANAVQQIQGLHILVYVGSTVLGGQKNCTLSMEADTIDISNKNDFGWSSFLAGARSWTVTCDGQFLSADAGQKALMSAFLKSEEVSIEMKTGEDYEGTAITYSGTAIISSLELEAAYNDVFAYSVEFNGKGKLNTSEATGE